MINEVEKYYNLNDPSKKGPRGFVFAYDEDGNLLFHQENMIVESGRKALMKYGFDKNGSYITKVVVGNSEDLTVSNDSSVASMVGEKFLETVYNQVMTDPEFKIKFETKTESKTYKYIFDKYYNNTLNAQINLLNNKYMLTSLAVIHDRIIDSVHKDIIHGVNDGTDYKYMTSEQKNLYYLEKENENRIIEKSGIITNIDEFKKLMIDKENGNIFYDKIPSDAPDMKFTEVIEQDGTVVKDNSDIVIIHSQQAAIVDKSLDIKGYDGSCFDIAHDEDGQVLGLCKIFIRHTDDDIENTSGYSQDWYSCLGLFMGDILFSRVVFPRYYKTSTNSIMFNYYIYF